MRFALPLSLVASVANAQDVGAIAEGLATKPITYMLALAMVAGIWLFRALMAEKDARLAQALDHAKALGDARAEGTLLAKQLSDGLDALEKVMDHVTRS
jgi:hypothetical protein